MKLMQTKLLFDGINEQKDCYIGIKNGNINFVGNIKPSGYHEIIANVGAITPSFINAHSHIGMVRSGEPASEEEANEQMNSIYPLSNALHSIYMGIKTALGYNPRSTIKWRGTRPSTRMGSITILRDNLLKAKKAMTLLEKQEKKS